MQNNKNAFVKLISVILAICIVAVLSACGKTDNKTTSADLTEQTEQTEQTELTESKTTQETTEEVITELDWVERIWESNTEVKVKIRVIPGIRYKIEDVEYDRCVIRLEDGQSISVEVQGLDYPNQFENMIYYFTWLNTEKVMVGKKSSVIVVVHDSGKTEVVSKLNDEFCLTTIGPDAETIAGVFGNCFITCDGEDYVPLDLSEEFEIRK